MAIEIEKLRECADKIWFMIPDKARKIMNPIAGEFIYAVMESIQNLCEDEKQPDTEANDNKPDVNLLNCDHEWKCDTFDCYGFPIEQYCDKCGEKQAI